MKITCINNKGKTKFVDEKYNMYNVKEIVEYLLDSNSKIMKATKSNKNGLSFVFNDCELFINDVAVYNKLATEYPALYEKLQSIFSKRKRKKKIVKKGSIKYCINKKLLATLIVSGITTGAIFKVLSSNDLPEDIKDDPTKKSTLATTETLQEKVDEYIKLNSHSMEEDIITLFKEGDAYLDFYAQHEKNDLTEYNSNYHLRENNKETINAIMKVSIESNIDPYLILALCFRESNIGNASTDEAFGIMQIEDVHLGEQVTYKNVLNDTIEVIDLTAENLLDHETNLKVGITFFKERLESYNYNVDLALYAYNMGEGAVDIVLSEYALKNGITYDYLCTLPVDDKLIEEFITFSDEPNLYLSKLSEENKEKYKFTINWFYTSYFVEHGINSNYGDGNYVNNVRQYEITNLNDYLNTEEEIVR